MESLLSATQIPNLKLGDYFRKIAPLLRKFEIESTRKCASFAIKRAKLREVGKSYGKLGNISKSYKRYETPLKHG